MNVMAVVHWQEYLKKIEIFFILSLSLVVIFCI